MKNKLKPLPASIRQKKRYFALKLESEKQINNDYVSKMLWHEMILIMGYFGTAESGFWIIESHVSQNTTHVIVACELKKYKVVRNALALITHIGNYKTRPEILGIAGTLKSLRTKYLKNTIHY